MHCLHMKPFACIKKYFFKKWGGGGRGEFCCTLHETGFNDKLLCACMCVCMCAFVCMHVCAGVHLCLVYVSMLVCVPMCV